MSLIRNPRHTVTVTPLGESLDEYGAPTYKEGEPVTVRCNVHPVSATDVEAYGLKPLDTYAVTTAPGAWPDTATSRIEWDGDTYTQRGRPLKARLGFSTQHDRIFMERGSHG